MQNLQYLKPKKIVLIGASTGGPSLIREIILNVNSLNGATMIVAQHMADGFIDSFANDLAKLNNHAVKIVEDGMLLHSNCIYFCKHHSRVKVKNDILYFEYKNIATGFNPNIDILFESFSNITKNIQILCVILTGMGSDGVNGCKKLTNAISITQSAKSAIVFFDFF